MGLPDNVLEYLGGMESFTFAQSFVSKYDINPVLVSSVLRILGRVATKEVPIDGLPKLLEDEFSLESDLARKAAVELVGYLAPVSNAVGVDVLSAVEAWGGDASAFKGMSQLRPKWNEPTELEQSEFDPAEESPVQRALADTGAVFSDPVLQHRLELIVASYRDGVRTREQAIGVLMRPQKTGGLAMSEQAAGDVLVLVASELGEPKPEPVAETADEPPARAVEPAKEGAKADVFTTEDEAEVKRVAEQRKSAMETPSLITDTKAAAEKIAADVKLSFATGELKTRFEHIIDARLRDVRDGFETRAKLEAATDQGGNGLSGAQLVAVMEMVEQMDAMHHKALAAGMEQKKQQALAEKAEKAQQAENVQVQEAQVMAKRYAEITGKAPTELVTPTPSRPTATPAAQAVQQREQQIDTAKVKAAIEAAKVPGPTVTPVLSEASIPSAPSGRPKVEDIRFERKLAGPVEELRLLTIVDFRRLSKDARQATQKIHDKVELVSQEGYDQRISAIKAWRESPLSQMYVALSREALISGKGIAQVLAQKRAAGEDVPTDDELKAIVELNGTLRF